MKVVVMGVAGSGKTTLGVALAQEIDALFLDADDFHTQGNISHMASGRPLTDGMRWPWLEACGTEMTKYSKVVLGCSALKYSYREKLREIVPDLRLVYPRVTPELIRARIAKRTGHYMPEQLIDSQFRTLDPPTLEENAIIVPMTLPIQRAAKLVASILLAK